MLGIKFYGILYFSLSELICQLFMDFEEIGAANKFIELMWQVIVIAV
jgi:hypothetical protein